MSTILPKRDQGRNEPCGCGSGLKFKDCHGDIVKQQICNQVANEKMNSLITEELYKRSVNKQEIKCQDTK